MSRILIFLASVSVLALTCALAHPRITRGTTGFTVHNGEFTVETNGKVITSGGANITGAVQINTQGAGTTQIGSDDSITQIVGPAQIDTSTTITSGVSLVIDRAGIAEHGTWVTGSDERIKDRVSSLNAHASLDKIKQLTPISFFYKPTICKTVDQCTKRHFGFVGQQVELVCPEAVLVVRTAEIPDFHAVSYSDLSALLVSATQQLTSDQAAQKTALIELGLIVQQIKTDLDKLKEHDECDHGHGQDKQKNY